MDNALLTAIKSDQYDQARRLIRSGTIDLTAVNAFGCTYMHYAVHYSGVAIIRLLIKKEPSIIDFVNDAGISPLHIACEKGKIEVVEILLQSNTKATSYVDIYDYRPRDCATRFGFTSILVLLDKYKIINK